MSRSGNKSVFITFSDKKNRNSRLLGHVNFDGQNHRFVRKGDKNGFISGLDITFRISRIWVKVAVRYCVLYRIVTV